MSNDEQASSEEAAGEAVANVTTVLVKTLRGLGQAGQSDKALELAASAWSALRHVYPEQAERINGTMHYLARRPDSATIMSHRDTAPNQE